MCLENYQEVRVSKSEEIWERSAGELGEQTPCEMAKAEESFPNWEQN